MDFEGMLQYILEGALRFVPRLVAALVMFVATLVLSSWVARWVSRTVRSKIDDPETVKLLSRLARWGVAVLGTILALDQVNFDVTGFLAGLGVAGITIGFALQDISRNFVAGMLLLLRQPFGIGDAVKIADHTGSVMTITTRDTVLKTWDGEMVILPNIDVFTSAITNYSELPNRRRTVFVGLGYDEDVSHAQRLFLETIRGVEGVLAEPAPTVYAEELGDSALTLAARFWVNQQAHSLLETHSRVVQAIKEVAEQEGIDLPYPTQTVRVAGGGTS
ncbi:MAG TPA: mechanosensitive ion channel family protein [Chloroflexi bacterium]|nr:mechanosensitive ion channel family protein [Chloroflexota bacterium]